MLCVFKILLQTASRFTIWQSLLCSTNLLANPQGNTHFLSDRQPTARVLYGGTQKPNFQVMLDASGAPYLKGGPPKLKSRVHGGMAWEQWGGRGVPVHFTLKFRCAERQRRVACIQYPPCFFLLKSFSNTGKLPTVPYLQHGSLRQPKCRPNTLTF